MTTCASRLDPRTVRGLCTTGIIASDCRLHRNSRLQCDLSLLLVAQTWRSSRGRQHDDGQSCLMIDFSHEVAALYATAACDSELGSPGSQILRAVARCRRGAAFELPSIGDFKAEEITF
mmetsp:Transcript_8784/g.21077  ORF Transcript_8784/g.21077 Transcript_8784/m.21077 type:complete len:119 (-) Transcript_8784:209-565(-)